MALIGATNNHSRITALVVIGYSTRDQKHSISGLADQKQRLDNTTKRPAMITKEEEATTVDIDG